MTIAVFTISMGFMLSNKTIKTKPLNSSSYQDRMLSVRTPGVAWLISFPQSNDIELMHFVQTVTQTTTASNYGNFLIDDNGKPIKREGDSVPIYLDKFGPSTTSTLPLPEKYILTSTHGYGTCVSCPPWKYMGFSALRQHMHANTWATKMKDGAFVPYKYDISVVKKVVVLYRDPLDVVVSRFFQHAKPGEKNHAGFLKYCYDQDHDSFSGPKENWFRQAKINDIAKNVPCNAEFVKIFTFYNMLEKVRKRFRLDVHYVSTKEIASNFAPSMKDLLSFLELTPVNQIPAKNNGQGEGDYFNFYTDDQRKGVADLGYAITEPEVWFRFEPYLKKYRDNADEEDLDVSDYII